ncbi:MAG: DUF1501 domain-containing protein [Saprospiraceae bacterium]|nr:DUF1501 domain-containing protein [Saprospiraceae bacterium]
MSNKSKHSTSCNQADHKMWSRRDFLQTLGITGGVGLAMGGFSVNALAAPLLNPPDGNERILVLIRLKGGNDGLNTIIPVYDFGTYKSKRPSIYIPLADTWSLSPELAMPKTTSSLTKLWNKGAMKVISGVGYQDHNLSHFTSSDIWNTANPEIETDANKSGWLGRYLLNNQPDYLENLPEIPGAIKVNSGSNIAFNDPERIDLAVNFNTPDKLIEIAERGFYYDAQNLPDDCYYGDQVGFLRSVLNVTYKYAPVISNAFKAGSNDVVYSNNPLSQQLSIVAKLIKGNLGTRLYMVTLDGFDTHENQNSDHPRLMSQLSAAVSEFYDDLGSGLSNNVLSVTFSEFGRRVAENAGGTDHGTAAPVLLFGSALQGNGALGQLPSLTQLDGNGNLKHSTDFRSIYATLLESWLCVPATAVDTILGQEFDRVDNMGIECLASSVADVPLKQGLSHYGFVEQDGSIHIRYELARPGTIMVELIAMTGQRIAMPVNEYQAGGKQETIMSGQRLGLGSGLYVYRITASGKTYSGKLVYVQ